MIRLQRAVVNPFQSGIRLYMVCLDRQFLYCTLMTDTDVRYTVDLSLGLVYPTNYCDMHHYYSYGPQYQRVLDLERRAEMTWDKKEKSKLESNCFELRRQFKLIDYPEASNLKTAVVRTLAVGQVGASDFEKGCKARGLSFSGKVINSYLGGWIFQAEDGHEMTAEEFVRLDLKQSE